MCPFVLENVLGVYEDNENDVKIYWRETRNCMEFKIQDVCHMPSYTSTTHSEM